MQETNIFLNSDVLPIFILSFLNDGNKALLQR